jgi:uncharacterized protein Yka (UPF0111/DUF47 family)
MAIQDVIEWLLPREDHFYVLLEQQAGIARKAAKALTAFSSADCNIEELATAVDAIEKEGDRIVGELSDRLAQTFVTPIDREDIQMLSEELDDITDFIHYGTRACTLVGVERATEPMILLADNILDATTMIDEALPKLRLKQYTELNSIKRMMRDVEKNAHKVYRAALHRMYRDQQLDVRRLLAEREVLDDLEQAIVRCERTASTLATLAVKHG